MQGEMDHTSSQSDGQDITRAIVMAALPHVPFDGWSAATLAAALRDTGHAAALGAGLFPRGGVDLAVAYHRMGDRDLAQALANQPEPATRYRDRIAGAVWLRLTLADKEAVRKSAALFALPHLVPESVALIWGTADAIWRALGDSSRDVNWYSKRATLSAVFSSTLLFWLGDNSPDTAETRAFLDRRIENVMQFEQAKGKIRQNLIYRSVFALPIKVLERISAPYEDTALPGQRR
jgi:ubiquinone biosynthesis protein COQ9